MNTCSPAEVAKKYAQGDSQNNIFKRLGCVLLILALILACAGSMICSVLAAIALLLGVVSMMLGKKKPKQKERDAQTNLYENGWICGECGNTWLPSETNADYDDYGDTPISGSLIWDSEDVQFIRVKCPGCNKSGKINAENVKRTYSSGYSLNVDCMCPCGFTSDRIKRNKSSAIKPEFIKPVEKIRILALDYEERVKCPVCGKVQQLILEHETSNSIRYKCLSCMQWHTGERAKRDTL